MNTEKETFSEDDMEARLWAYLDGQSDEPSAVEDLLRENAAWKEKYGELLELHTLMGQIELEQPSMRFTKNVMEAIVKHGIAPATKAYINKNIVWGIAVFFIVVIAGFLGYGFSQISGANYSPQSSGIGSYLSGVDYSKLFNNNLVNGFMMLNVVLGLFLLDRFLNLKRRQRTER